MKSTKPRSVDIVVISDIHLGTYGCRARALESYLKSVRPKKLILNGDIIDVWQFSKNYWPKTHMKVVKRFLTFLSKKTEVVFIPGNHDELFRKFVGTKIGRLSIKNKVTLELEGERVWIFHGDAFDVTMQHSRWLVKLGAVGYDLLILMNAALNAFLLASGRSRISFSARIKASVKKAVSYVNSFEQTVADIAHDQGFDTVICGHIHQPADKLLDCKTKSIRYLNSGDWIENLTALEYNEGAWSLYRHEDTEEDSADESDDLHESPKLFEMLRSELLISEMPHLKIAE